MRLSLVLCPLVFALACQPKPQTPDAPKKSSYPAPKTTAGGTLIAQVGPVAFTTAEIEARMAQQSSFALVRLQNEPDALAKFVEKEIRLETLAQEGWRRGYPDDPKIQAQLKRLVVTKVMNEELDRVGKELNLSEADVQKAFDARKAEFNKPEKIRLSHIQRLVSDAADASKDKVLLTKLKKELEAAHKNKKHQAFADAAQKYSDDEQTKAGGGDLQFLNEAQLETRAGKKEAAALFAAPVGSHHLIVRPDKVSLYKITGRRRGVKRTLEQVKPQVRGQLIADRRNEAFDAVVTKLYKEHNVTINEEAIKSVKIPDDKPVKGNK